MLKYVILFCIISVCHPHGRMVGNYDELVFGQSVPGAVFFAYQNKLQKKETTSNETLEYLRSYVDVLRTRKWFIRFLRATDSIGRTLIDCHDGENNSLIYQNMVPDDAYALELKSKWPSFDTNEEDDIWESNYNNYGSCIKPTTIEYFDFAVFLLHEHNVGTMLENDGVVSGPNKTYQLSRIISAIKRYTRKLPYILCLPVPRNNQQYLLEVQICFDRSLNFINCHSPVFDLCVEGKSIIYPGWRG